MEGGREVAPWVTGQSHDLKVSLLGQLVAKERRGTFTRRGQTVANVLASLSTGRWVFLVPFRKNHDSWLGPRGTGGRRKRSGRSRNGKERERKERRKEIGREETTSVFA